MKNLYAKLAVKYGRINYCMINTAYINTAKIGESAMKDDV